MNKYTFQKIYVDTNILINYCNNIQNDKEVLDYLFKHRRKEVLFTSSLAIVQTIIKLQTGNKNRKKFTRDQIVEKLNHILPKFTIIDLNLNDIMNGVNSLNEDVEDSIHYAMSQKLKCDCILTNNTKDFYFFRLPAFKPVLNLAKLNFK